MAKQPCGALLALLGWPARLEQRNQIQKSDTGEPMEYTTLGRTGLKVSVAGLGCGGFSRLGLGTGKSEADAIAIIREALDLGVNLFDTAAAYGTEPVLGKALAGVTRDQVVICTKAPFGVSNPDSR